MKAIILLAVFLFSTNSFAAGNESKKTKNYFDKKETCLVTKDLKEVATHFDQLKKYTQGAGKEVCKKDMGDKWFEIARSVLALKNIQTDPVDRDTKDDLTRRAIQERDWWGYFKKRADRFSIPSSCREGVVAYVIPSFLRGQIHLCDPYFKQQASDQLDTLMHEVRHFDGFGHVTCKRGSAKGRSGACDGAISEKGSYAISAQTSVEMAFAGQLSKAERAGAQATAVFMIFNRFNKLPVYKADHFIYMSNKEGEVWRWPTAGTANDLELVAELEEPAKIYSNGSTMTIYPLNTGKEAYRMYKTFDDEIEAKGAFAEKYNKDSKAERKKYSGVNYLGQGLIAKDEELWSFCGEGGLKSIPFTKEKIKTIVSVGTGDDETDTHVMGESGQLYKYSCSRSSGRLSVREADVKLPKDTLSSFSLDDIQYTMSENGDVKELSISRTGAVTSQVLLSGKGKKWVSATPLRTFDLFEKPGVAPRLVELN